MKEEKGPFALEFRQNHRTLDAILSKVPVGIVILSMEREVLWLNKSALDMMEVASEDEIVGRSCNERLCHAECGNCPVLDRGQILDHSERTLRKSSGIVIPILKSALKTTLDGAPVLIEAFSDISEQKKLEDEKAMMEVKLRHGQKLEAIGQLAAGIAHEINTPIQFISDNLNFLSQSFEDVGKILSLLREIRDSGDPGSLDAREKITKAMKKMEEADLDFAMSESRDAIAQSLEGASRIAKIVQAMKEFSHGSGKNASLCDLNRIIENTAIISKNEWKYCAELSLDLCDGALNVIGASDELGQVLLNLIVNAAHAVEDAGGSESSRGRIEIISSRNGSFAEVSVSDSGEGIPDEIKSRIFDPFFTTKDVGRGSGQGLSISYDIIVRKHKGSLSFSAGKNGGTVFSIKLPTAENDG